MNRARLRSFALSVSLLCVALSLLAGPGTAHPEEGPAIAIAPSAVAAAGEQAALVRVARFGRYALRAVSSEGVGLQLVDRLAGPRESAGNAGQRDGRFDLFLDHGEYKLISLGPQGARGSARLEALPFVEQNGPQPALLPELKPVDTTLDDLQQRSYWIHVEERRVLIEAAGRNLADLRLWRDGSWLVDARPETAVVQPKVGQPLFTCRLHALLTPGLYLLTAYGGPSQPWSEDDGTHPLFLRSGLPRLAEVGRRRYTVSPFGVDRYLAPGPATLFRLELPEARTARLGVARFDAERPFGEPQQTGEIDKTSVPPVVELSTGADRDHVVTITGDAGQPYVLQHFPLRSALSFFGEGEHWLATVHTGHAADTIDATGIVVPSRFPGDPRQVGPWATQVLELDGITEWTRHVNLLDPLTLFLHAGTAASLQVTGEGVDARYRLEPFLLDTPEHYESPPFRPSPASFDLEPGYWVLTVEPAQRGVLDLHLRRSTGLLSQIASVLTSTAGPGSTPLSGALRFGVVNLERGRSYSLHVNRQPQVKVGLVLREVPLDLAEALPVAQAPGETVSVPFEAREPGVLRAEADDGARLELSLDGGSWQSEPAVMSGRHTVAVRNPGQRAAQYALAYEPQRLRREAPLPSLPDTALASLPQFPELTTEAPVFLDLAHDASATYNLRVEKDGLYQLESTGLLATRGAVRSRTVTGLFVSSGSAGEGVGRNFQVRSYLRAGDYQLTVAPEGTSAGHLGLRLARAPLADGSFLTSHLPARAMLKAGEALAYSFVITKPGSFRLQALALGRTLRCRLEDQDGWPLLPPGGDADITRRFGPGRYRLVILPEPTAARVVTLIEPVLTTSRRLAGHGPHPLRLGRSVLHTWMEGEEGAARRPDVWELTLPADVDASVRLSGEMQAELRRLAEDDSAEPEPVVLPGGGWSGPLRAGRYRLAVVCARRDNQVPYEIGVYSAQLVPGLEREISAPAEVSLAIGRQGVVDITSFGASDVKARLFDAAGRLIADNDDRPDDWNFALTLPLVAGRYRLQVDPVGATSASTRVTLRTPREEMKPALSLPGTVDLNLGRETQVLPLEVPRGGNLLLVSLRSAESVGLSIEAQGASGWRALGSATGRVARLELPLPSDDQRPALRLRAFSLDGRPSPAQLLGAVAEVTPAGEPELRKGLALQPLAGPARGFAASVRLTHAGLLHFDDDPGVRACAGTLRLCTPLRNGLAAASSGWLFLVGEMAGRVRAERVRLGGTHKGVSLGIEDGALPRVDLETAGGPVLAEVRSEVGRPGVKLAEVERAPEATGPAMAVGNRSAVAVSLSPRQPQAMAFMAEGSGASAAELRLEALAFSAPSSERVELGSHQGALEARRAHALLLPDGTKRMRVTLEAGVVAVLSRDHAVLSLHGGDEAVSETLESAADTLTLLNARGETAHWTVEALPLSGAEPSLRVAWGHPFEASEARAGRWRLEVVPSSLAARLHVRGAVGDALLITAAGRVQQGRDFPLDGDGGPATLLIPHGPGLVLAWIDRPQAEAADLWARESPPAERLNSLPVRLRLAGQHAAWRFDVTQPALLHVRSADPSITLLKRGSEAPLVEAHERNTRLDAFLAPGPVELRLRALGEESLSGEAELLLTPVTSLGEGAGPEALLGPGDTRLYSFTLDHAGQIGVGVKASVETAEVRLLEGTGRELGRGVLQMPTLEPGTYLIAIHAAEDGGPVRVRPALAGLHLPDTGPPAEVVLGYLAPEGQPSFSARRVTTLSGVGSDRRPEGEEEGSSDDDDGGSDDEAPDEGGGSVQTSGVGGGW